MPLPPALASGLCAAPARFVSAWDAYQFAAEHLATQRRLLGLAEAAALPSWQIDGFRISAEAAEKMLAAAAREWRATGPGG
jgi:hypothetical protein